MNKQLLTEGKSDTSMGCLMLSIKNKVKNWADVLKIIQPEDLYDDESEDYGKEKDPHATILYGFDPSVKPSQIKALMDDLSQYIKLTITGIDVFEGGKQKPYDVVKFSVESDDLSKLNALCKDKFPYENGFPTYIPHITIAYVKVGEGKKYVKKLKPTHLEANKFIYSLGKENTVDWSIKKKYRYKIKI